MSSAKWQQNLGSQCSCIYFWYLLSIFWCENSNILPKWGQPLGYSCPPVLVLHEEKFPLPVPPQCLDRKCEYNSIFFLKKFSIYEGDRAVLPKVSSADIFLCPPCFMSTLDIMSEKIRTGVNSWGLMTHICISKLTIIGSDNGLSPGRHQAIIWTNAGILSIGHLGTNFNEILITIPTFSCKQIYLKMSSGKRRPFSLSLNVLKEKKKRGNVLGFQKPQIYGVSMTTITIVDSLWHHNDMYCYVTMRSQGKAFCLVMLQFPHSAFARGPRSPVFEERMRVAMGATGERSAGRPPHSEWHVYWFLLISTRDIKLCNNLYLSF